MRAEAPIVIESDEKIALQERCGIVGIFSPEPARLVPLALLAGGGVQHRGQNGVGIALPEHPPFVAPGLLSESLRDPKLQQLSSDASNWVMLHCRYGTDGGYGENNLQPVVTETVDGKRISVIHNGQFVATSAMRAKLSKPLPEDASDTVIFAHLLAQSPGESWDERIIHTLGQVNGAYSLLIGVDGALYAARDQFGLRPMVLGTVPGYGLMVASETLPFHKVRGSVIREVERGELLRIDKHGVTVIRCGSSGPGNACDFEFAYFSHPSSLYPDFFQHGITSWRSYAQFRERCGRVLARESPVEGASFVVGVPDSGVAVATGYAAEASIPYRQLLFRDHFDPNGNKRLFLDDEQMAQIHSKVLGKILITPDRSAWKDAIVVIPEDSIVRGNVSPEITLSLFELGAREVHLRLSLPPVIGGCHLGVSIRTDGELIAARHDADPERIAKAIGATSVRYISPKGFLTARYEATQLAESDNPRTIFLDNGGCGGCMMGIYPISKEGEIYQRGKT